MQPMTEFVRH